MPLTVEISLINAIEGEYLEYQDLNNDEITWKKPPPPILTPFKYQRCSCQGPSSGFELAVKYGGLICRLDVTAWGIHYRKSTPTKFDMEVVLIQDSNPYCLEIIMI